MNALFFCVNIIFLFFFKCFCSHRNTLLSYYLWRCYYKYLILYNIIYPFCRNIYLLSFSRGNNFSFVPFYLFFWGFFLLLLFNRINALIFLPSLFIFILKRTDLFLLLLLLFFLVHKFLCQYNVHKEDNIIYKN